MKNVKLMDKQEPFPKRMIWLAEIRCWVTESEEESSFRLVTDLNTSFKYLACFFFYKPALPWGVGEIPNKNSSMGIESAIFLPIMFKENLMKTFLNKDDNGNWRVDILHKKRYNQKKLHR